MPRLVKCLMVLLGLVAGASAASAEVRVVRTPHSSEVPDGARHRMTAFVDPDGDFVIVH